MPSLMSGQGGAPSHTPAPEQQPGGSSKRDEGDSRAESGRADAGKPGDSPSKGDRVRWLLALAVGVAAGYYFLDATSAQIVCEDVVKGTDAAPRLIEACGPPRLIDLAPFVLVIALLVWPDLSELGVTGLVTLRRRVTQQEERQQLLEDRLIEVHQAFMQTAAAVQGQSQASTTNVYYGEYAPDQGDVSRGIAEKQGAERRHPQPAEGGPPAASQTELLGTFLREYAALEPYIVPSQLRNAPRWSPKRLGHLSDEQQRLVEDWNERFAGEVRAVRQTRNVAVHEPDTLSDDTLRGAINNTRALKGILFDRLGISPG